MQDSLTGDALFVHLLMQRQVDPRLFLVVEGDDELTILAGHIDDQNVLVIMGGGKPAVLRAGELVQETGMTKALALVDRDLDDLTGASAEYPTTVVATEGYDFATDILESDWEVLRRAAVANGGVAAVAKVEGSTSRQFVESVRRITNPVTALRLVNQELALGLNLRKFPFQDILGTDLEPKSHAAILARANDRSPVVVQFSDVASHIDDATERIRAAGCVAGGHDLFGAAGAALRASGATGAGAKQIAASVFTAVNCELMKSLSVFTRIQAWASTYGILAFTC